LATRYPTAKLFLLLGEDTLASFEKWRDPKRILELATLAVMRRAGGADEGEKAKPVPGGVLEVSTRRVDVSSTEIRARLKAGKSIKGFVPESVERFIDARGLYR
jgi:nicotinate-nucleotide adenylyltransferase